MLILGQKIFLRYGGSSYGSGGGRGTAAAAASGYHAGSSPGPADLYAATTEYVQQATSPQPQSNGYQMQMNRVSLLLLSLGLRKQELY